MRELATVRQIQSLEPISGANFIELAKVDGWQSVVPKGDYSVGDLCVYIEIDSWIPLEVVPFLANAQVKKIKLDDDSLGVVIKTVKKKGVLSQGLILPLETIPENFQREGEVVTEILGIKLYEPFSSDTTRLGMVGNFPSVIPKTSLPRIQNLKRDLRYILQNISRFRVTEKLDGESATYYILGGEFSSASKNVVLEKNLDHPRWQVAQKYNLEEALRSFRPNGQIAVQGEFIGPNKAHRNWYELGQNDFRVFNIYDIAQARYLNREEFNAAIDFMKLKAVPELTIPTEGFSNIEDLLSFADGKSLIAKDKLREGVVFCDYPYEEEKREGFHDLAFKVISNKFLLNQPS